MRGFDRTRREILERTKKRHKTGLQKNKKESNSLAQATVCKVHPSVTHNTIFPHKHTKSSIRRIYKKKKREQNLMNPKNKNREPNFYEKAPMTQKHKHTHTYITIPTPNYLYEEI